MEQRFDSDAFIRRIGESLVDEFKDAKAGTTPSMVGSAAEQPVRDQLEQVLPRGIAAGEGCVIDSYGGTSHQQDAVLYERDICPVFSINRTPQTTYYPCESAIGVGEVKSRLDFGSIENSFMKIASVKRLRRHIVYHGIPKPDTGEMIPNNRNYLTPHGDSILRMDEGSERKERLQIFGSILEDESRLKKESLVAAFVALAAKQIARGLPPPSNSPLTHFSIMPIVAGSGTVAGKIIRETIRVGRLPWREWPRCRDETGDQESWPRPSTSTFGSRRRSGSASKRRPRTAVPPLYLRRKR